MASTRGRACLFITSNMLPLRNFRGGGPAVAWDHLRSLHALGYEVTLLSYFYRDAWPEWSNVRASADYRALEELCRSITIAHATGAPSLWQRAAVRLPRYRARGISDGSLLASVIPAVGALYEELRPAIVWAEHVAPLRLALLQAPRTACVVYAHHDFPERVKALGANRPVNEARIQDTANLAAAATVTVSPSATEAEELRRRGCANVHYVPLAIDTAQPPDLTPPSADWSPRLIHLGGMKTTATREGLRMFVERAWPKLSWQPSELVIVGDLAGMDEPLRKLVAGATCRGFVEDLASELSPFDLHIIPWPFDTGVRTRLSVAFSRAQVVVATRASVSGSPEVRDGENCVLVDDVDAMPAVLEALRHDRDRLVALGRAAYATYQQQMSPAASQRHIETALATCPAARAG